MAEEKVTRIRVGKHPTGIIGLEEALQEVSETMGGEDVDDDAIREALLNILSKKNYISLGARDLYGEAFLREYKKFIGVPYHQHHHSGIEVKVLGMGCPRCDQLERDLMSLIAEMNIDADLEHIRDPVEIGQYGVMGSPGLVINGDVKAVGVVPSKAKLKTWLEEAAQKATP